MSASLWYSLIGHIIVVLLCFITFPDFQKQQSKLDSVPILIDLKNIEIADKTNLPAKASVKKKTSVLEELKKEVKPVPVAEPKKAPAPKPVQKAEPLKDAAKAVEAPVKKETKPAPKVKSKPKVAQPEPVTQKAQVKSKPKPKKQEDGLESLLASVEKMSAMPTKAPATKEADVSDLISGVLNGVEGGATSNLGTKLTVSQVDFIAASIRKNWRLDAGIEGLENMIVEIKLSLSRDGRVSGVEFLNQARYNQDKIFQSVAEGARRAIYICDSLGEESPFRMLAQKYPERYSDWQKIQLRFNPLDGGVF